VPLRKGGDEVPYPGGVRGSEEDGLLSTVLQGRWCEDMVRGSHMSFVEDGFQNVRSTEGAGSRRGSGMTHFLDMKLGPDQVSPIRL
jgi:hypothetical protein